MHFPRPPLAPFVESITYFAGAAPLHHREKLIPDGAIQIIVDITERPKKLYAGETSAVAVDFRKAWISGMQRRWIVIEAQPAASMLIIRFRPGGAFGCIGHAADALTDAVFALDDVIDGSASLRDRVLEAPDIAAKFKAAESWLSERLAPAPPNATVRFLTGRMQLPVTRIRDLVAETGYSERHILALFRRLVGVSPKQYARIRRFNHLLRVLAGTGVEDPALRARPLPPPDWAALAADLGYADQSHLNHEFQAFAGMTPGAYVSAYRGLENYLPITLQNSG